MPVAKKTKSAQTDGHSCMSESVNLKGLVCLLDKLYSCGRPTTGVLSVRDGIGIDLDAKKILVPHDIEVGHENGLDLKKPETWSTLMLLLLLQEKGYPNKSIHLEKTFQLGVANSGRVDFYLSDSQNEVSFMIDAKNTDAFNSALTSRNKRRNVKQLLSYARQDDTTSRVSFYNYDFKNQGHQFASINTDDLRDFRNTDDAAKGWNGQYNHRNFIREDDIFFRPTGDVIQYADLVDLSPEGVKNIKKEFIDSLRINSVSDKPGAFMVLVNLLLCKIYDEAVGRDTELTLVNDDAETRKCQGVQFQYVRGAESDICLMKRMQDLLMVASEQFLGNRIIDYSDDEIDQWLKDNMSLEAKEKIKSMFDALRLKRNNPFSFVDVYDDKTFTDNAAIVKDVISILAKHKFRYNYRQQFLGDFFEELLVTSLKQDEGQFFTPVPLVDFIVEALPINKLLDGNLGKSTPLLNLPKMIDYSCGPGHFLMSYMDKMQGILKENKYRRLYDGGDDYGWVKHDNVVGIEKDYRLAKTAKIASFFNGDGEMKMITGDGINKFSSNEYRNSCLSGDHKVLGTFDFVLSNPPFSVKGFYRNFQKNGVDSDDFSLLKTLNLTDRSAEIEVFFVERAWQLLRDGGIAVLLLPQSVLSMEKYAELRKYLISKFRINAMFLGADSTFFGTSASPVTLFMEKTNMPPGFKHDTLFMYSEKYRNIRCPKGREEEFLGYKFSSNKNTASIRIVSGGGKLKTDITPVLKAFLQGEKPKLPTDGSCAIKTLQSVMLNESHQIFPKFDAKSKGLPLGHFFDCRRRKESPTNEIPYLEIGDIQGGKIPKTSGKMKRGTLCEKGDILVPSLTPTRGKICVADKRYVVSSVFAVLAVKKEHRGKRVELLNKIKEDDVLKQMNSLIEGFKISYAKFSMDNLLNHVKVKL